MLGLYNYWIAIILMMIGFYGIIAKKNLIKQAIALGLFQTGVFLFYISMGVHEGGTAPVWAYNAEHTDKLVQRHDNPLVHVLILTAIVVSVSILAVALAIIVNIKRAYGTVEEDELQALDKADAEADAAGDAGDVKDEEGGA